MRVMHVFGGRYRSGVESIVLAIAGGACAAGHEVILTPLATRDGFKEGTDVGCVVDALDKRGSLSIGSIRRLARKIRSRGVDLVHSHAVNGAFYASPAARLAKVKHVHTVHVDTKQSLLDVCRAAWPRSVAHWMHTRLARMADHVTTVNPDLREALLRQGVPASDVTFIPNCIDVSRFDDAPASQADVRRELGIPLDARVVGTVCRLSRFKNLPMLLRAAKAVAEGGHPVHLLIAGEGSEGDALKSLANELGIGDRVCFAGWRSDTHRVYGAMDVFALSSLIEGMPVAVLEAMAARLPVVATRVGGTGEVVTDGVTGFMAESEDEAAFTEKLTRLVAAPEQGRAMGAKGRERVEQAFTPEAISARYLELYEKVVTPHGG